MSQHAWPTHLNFRRWELEPEDRSCPDCGRWMHLCDHRHRRFYTLTGPVHLVSKLAHCPDASCPSNHRTFAALAEFGIAAPRWVVGWDVFAWIGQRRFVDHQSVPAIRAELARCFDVALSEDSIESHIARYQAMVAAGRQGPQTLGETYRGAKGLTLSIDGLQGEVRHQTLYIVRELGCRRVWFAQARPAGAPEDARKLLEQTRDWAERLGVPVRAWHSDMRPGFVAGIAEVFPGVAHRFSRNYFALSRGRGSRPPDAGTEAA